MPLMFVTYMLQYLDKITLGYTAVLGIQADTVSQPTLRYDTYLLIHQSILSGSNIHGLAVPFTLAILLQVSQALLGS